MITHTPNRGPFVKHCPCSPGSVSCGYFNLNLHTGCPYTCSYCILQEYLDTRQPVLFSNWDDMESELTRFAADHPHGRIGTGELSDSLAWDKQFMVALRLIELFRSLPHIVFEFKTKSVEIGAFVKAGSIPPNIVISWSLAPEEVVRYEEIGTPPIDARLAAIEEIRSLGCRIGLHFDPLILTEGWQEQYGRLLERVAAKIGGEGLAWISLGALRFSPAMRDYILRHPRSRLFQGELVKGYDGKYRYFKPQRRHLFHHIKKLILSHYPQQVPIYLCMEDPEMWSDVFPGRSTDESELNRHLHDAVFR